MWRTREMNKEDQIDALESCLNRAVEEQPDSCHLIGLCVFVDMGADYSPDVCELIRDLMVQVNLRHEGFTSSFLHRIIANQHRDITGQFMSDSELRIAWENEWRNYIKSLRDSL